MPSYTNVHDPKKNNDARHPLDIVITIVLSVTTIGLLIPLISVTTRNTEESKELAQVCRLTYDHHPSVTEFTMQRDLTSLNFPMQTPTPGDCTRCAPQHGMLTYPLWMSIEDICLVCDLQPSPSICPSQFSQSAWKTKYCVTAGAYAYDHIKICAFPDFFDAIWTSGYCQGNQTAVTPMNNYFAIGPNAPDIAYDGALFCTGAPNQ